MASNVWEIDRTSILTYQKCPRERYFSRHYRGQGLERKQKSLPLQFGSAFHEGAESLLTSKGIEAAAARAINYLNLAFSVEGVDMGDEKATTYGIEEQRAIAEGLLRAWWAKDGERFLREFEVLEVEQEGRAQLSDDMVLMFRPDALVRERLTGDLYVCSWKTASMFGQMTINQINSDMQSMSEVWGREWLETKKAGFNPDVCSVQRIEGVLYLIAVKGKRRLDDYTELWVQDTPLVYGWLRKGVTEDDDEWTWCGGWKTEDINPKTGKNVRSKVGKGFRKVSIWDNYPGGVKEWIADLAAQRITPRHINALDTIFPQSMPVSRREDEIESWKRQTVAQELRVAANVDKLREWDLSEGPPPDAVLDELFPQHSARCFDYQSRCSFWDACFTPAVHADPLGSGLYQIRIPNHPTEKGTNDD